MSWESEFDAAFIAVLTGDSTLTALLSGASSVYRHRPATTTSYPCLVYKYGASSDQGKSKDGKYEVQLQLDVYGPQDELAAIRDRLHTLLDERARARQGIAAIPVTMTNYTCRQFRFLRQSEIATGEFDADSDNKEVIQLVTEWRVWLYLK